MSSCLHSRAGGSQRFVLNFIFHLIFSIRGNLCVVFSPRMPVDAKYQRLELNSIKKKISMAIAFKLQRKSNWFSLSPSSCLLHFLSAIASTEIHIQMQISSHSVSVKPPPHENNPQKKGKFSQSKVAANGNILTSTTEHIIQIIGRNTKWMKKQFPVSVF